jgi:hypothetical protein
MNTVASMATDLEREVLPRTEAASSKRKLSESDVQRTDGPNKRTRLSTYVALSSETDIKAVDAVESSHDVQTHSISSGSKIQRKVTAVLQHLPPSTNPASTATAKICVLRARAPDAAKMISIAEIAKRELEKEEGTRWFQYVTLGEEIQERPRGSGESGCAETVLGGEAKTPHDEDDDGDDYEVMEKPSDRALHGRPLVRGVPIMSLFLSRVSVAELRNRYGEQTNDTPASPGES